VYVSCNRIVIRFHPFQPTNAVTQKMHICQNVSLVSNLNVQVSSDSDQENKLFSIILDTCHMSQKFLTFYGIWKSIALYKSSLLNTSLRQLIQACFFNPLNAELNPICHLVALLGAHHILHVSRIRVKILFNRELR